jgi:uncharacterized RDD family membrane protein YckC
MKCPKCEYLGFEAADRCRNCGYQFALLAHRSPVDMTGSRERPPAPAAPASRASAGTLPLFGQSPDADDEPLIRVPRAPRPPLAVRRTPQTPRARTRVSRAATAPVLAFPDESGRAESARPGARAVPAPAVVPASGIRRGAAAALDHLLLALIGLVVVYLTLRMMGLTMGDWRLVPPGPMIAFFVLIEGAYFAVFTACGGQTPGKMALGLQVVSDDGRPFDATRVAQRTLLGAVSMLSVGVTYVPALLGPDGRALHDRVARTRVVVVPVA